MKLPSKSDGKVVVKSGLSSEILKTQSSILDEVTTHEKTSYFIAQGTCFIFLGISATRVVQLSLPWLTQKKNMFLRGISDFA